LAGVRPVPDRLHRLTGRRMPWIGTRDRPTVRGMPDAGPALRPTGRRAPRAGPRAPADRSPNALCGTGSTA